METNMKNVKKIGLSALAGALAFTSANAGDVSLSGSMIASFTKKGGYNTTGNPLGMNKELTVSASGELDNGVSVAYKQTITNAMGYNDSELVFTGVPMAGDATLALTSAGAPISAIDDVTPIAFEEASAAVGSLKDVNGADGNYGIRYTLADMMGSGMTLDAFYSPNADGDDQAEKGTGGVSGSAEEAWEVVLKGSVPGVDGLDIGAGYATQSHHNDTATTADGQDVHEGTVYATYAFGGLKVGAQKGVVNTEGTGETNYENDYLGVSYAVSDNLSISYNTIDSRESKEGSDVEQDFDSISLSYTSGGMTIGVLDADCGNCSYSSSRDQSARSIQMTIAF
jgi:outer membrane protein OmpU